MKLGRVLVVMGAIMLSACGEKTETPKPVPPPTPPAPPVVPMPPPAPVEKPVFTPVIATLEGSTETPVKSPVAGFIIQQSYHDNAIVKKGTVLFIINPILSQPAATPASEERKPKYQAIIAPADGVAGRSAFGSGDSVAQGATLTNISTIDPIEAEFVISADYYSKCANRMTNDLNLPLDQRAKGIALVRADGTSYPQKGSLEKIEVGSKAGSPITVHALFPNPDRTLEPGQFVRIQSLFP